jgi:hypothetical protein
VRRSPNDPSAAKLRRAEPELALRLETAQLIAEAEALELEFRVRRSLKNVAMEVAMSDGLLMRISPIRKGAKGFAEWGIYLKNPFKPDQLEFLIHAHIEIFHQTEKRPSEFESFTTMGKRLEGILNQGIQIFHTLTGATISTVIKGGTR